MTSDERVVQVSARSDVRLARITDRGRELVEFGTRRLGGGDVPRPAHRPHRLTAELARAIGAALIEFSASAERAEAEARAGRHQAQRALWAPPSADLGGGP